MIYYYYVYLTIDQNRLVITESKINDGNYRKLMDNNGGNRQQLFNTCKMFCLGYLYGSRNGGRKVVNDPHEFV